MGARVDIEDSQAQERPVARLTSHSRTTVYRALHPQQRQPLRKSGRKKGLEPHKDYLRDRYLTAGLSGVRLHEELRLMGGTGAIGSARRYFEVIRCSAPSIGESDRAIRDAAQRTSAS